MITKNPKIFSTIIAGGRDYEFTKSDIAWLDSLPIGEVVSGCARGADSEGEAWAASRGVPVKRFPADWQTHGRAAGMLRNAQMAAYADALAIFPGGKGTQDMHRKALDAGLTVFKSGLDYKSLRCDRCERDIWLPSNHAGGFWHLSGWSNPHGIKFSGGYCSPCFTALHDVLPTKEEP